MIDLKKGSQAATMVSVSVRNYGRFHAAEFNVHLLGILNCRPGLAGIKEKCLATMLEVQAKTMFCNKCSQTLLLVIFDQDGNRCLRCRPEALPEPLVRGLYGWLDSFVCSLELPFSHDTEFRGREDEKDENHEQNENEN